MVAPFVRVGCTSKVSESLAVAFSLVVRLIELFVRRVVVEGTSMAPTYRPGERLTVVRLVRARVGDVVVAPDPRSSERWLLKRCVAREDGRLELRGDNPSASTDSRDFGSLPASRVRWRVARAFWRPNGADR